MIRYICSDGTGTDVLEVKSTSLQQLATETLTLAMRIHGQIAARDPEAAAAYIALLRVGPLPDSPVITAPASGQGTTVYVKKPNQSK